MNGVVLAAVLAVWVPTAPVLVRHFGPSHTAAGHGHEHAPEDSPRGERPWPVRSISNTNATAVTQDYRGC